MTFTKKLLPFKIIAWFMGIMGVIHCSLTPVIIKDIPFENRETMLVFLFMFLATGLFFIYIGYSLFQLAKQISANLNYSSAHLWVIVFLVFVTGALGAYTMIDNPFAWLTLVAGILLIIFALNLKNKKQ